MPKKTEIDPHKPGPKPRSGEATHGTSVFTMRLTGEERAQYEAAAKAKSMSVSEWIRDCCKRILGRK